jgi:penicillin-binding protein 1A
MKNLLEIKTLVTNTLDRWLKPVTEPISSALAPYRAKWQQIIAPVTRSWEVYKQRNPRETKIITWIFTMVKWGFAFVFLIVLLTLFGVFGKLPSTDDIRSIETSNASEIYSSDNVMIGKYYTENRTTIELDSISPYLITALLAIEDKRFFEHSGIDLRSWMRVFKGVATNSQGLGGGSTLSQQLAKNLYPRKDYKIKGLSIFINKVRENIISIKLEKIYNKEELLTMYLNTVPFGGNRFGIQEASRYFYGKRPKQLTAAEAATLIGMLKATTALDPTRNPKNSEKRRNLVLFQMVKNKDFRFDSDEMTTISRMVNTGAITQAEYEKLIKTPIGATPHEDIGNNEGLGTYFREYLRTKELAKILKNIVKEDGTSYNIYTDGLKIYTTLDSRMQKHAEESVFKHMSYIQKEFYNHWKGYKDEKPWGDDKWIDEQVKRSERYKLLVESGFGPKEIDSIFKVPTPMKVFAWKDKPIEKDTMMTPLDSVRYYFTMLNTGFMAMDHSNGYVKAWVGGTDFKYFKYDHNISKRQVGSTFKPIVYAAAVADGMSPCKYFHNKEITIEDWSPKNSDDKYGGYYSMTGGLAYSENVIAAQIIEKVGIQKTIDMATKLGVTSTLPREFGISLGAAEVSLYDMMKVYSTIANTGYKTEPVAVLKIEDRYGKIIYDFEKIKANNKPIQVLDSTTALTMTRMMQNVIIYGTANTLRSQYCKHCDFAGKTGTTQNHSDGWFVGYNPKLVTGVWVGGPSPAVRFRSMAYGRGAALAMPIVGNFWYKLSIDPKFASLTQEEFNRHEEINSKMNCPLRLGFSPDKYYAVMQDSTLKDSMMRTGFRGLRNIVEEMFPEEVVEEPAEIDGEGGEMVEKNTEVKVSEKPEAHKPPEQPKATEKKKPQENTKEKPKEIPKKGNG